MFDERLHTLTRQIADMTPQQRQQFAMQHRDDPILVSMAKFVTDKENHLRAALQAQQQGAQGEPPKVVDQTIASIGELSPPAQDERTSAGIGALPAQNIGMADGGIVGFRDGGFKYASSEAEKDQAFILHGEYRKAQQRLAQAQEAAARARSPEEQSEAQDAARRASNDLEGLRREMKAARIPTPDGSAPGPVKVTYEPGTPAPATTAAAAPAQAQPTTAAAGPATNPNQIPGLENSVDPTFRGKHEAQPLGQSILSAGDAGLHFLSRVPAMGIGALHAAGRAGVDVLQGKSKEEIAKNAGTAFEGTANAVTYAPKTEGGQASAESVQQALIDSKLPPFIGRIVGGPGKYTPRGKTPAAKLAERSETQAEAAQYARDRANTLNSGPKPPAGAALGPQQPGAVNPNREAIIAERGARNAERTSATSAQRAGEADLAARTAGRAAGQEAKLGIAAGSQIADDTTPGGGIADVHAANDDFRRQEIVERGPGDPPPEKMETGSMVAGGAGGAAQHRDPSFFDGISPEDWITFGLGMMANKSRNVGQAIGESGLGALAARGQRAKQQSSAEYLKALARQANASADASTAGLKPMAQAQKYADQAMDQWLKARENSPKWLMLDDAERDRQMNTMRQKFLREAQQQLKIAGPLEGSPSPAATNNQPLSNEELVAKYLDR